MENNFTIMKDSPSNNTTIDLNNSNIKSLAEQAKLKGNKYYNEGDYYKAYEMYSLAISSATEAETLATFYSNRSNACMQIKDYNKALSDAEKCIELRPEWSRGYYRKAISLISIGDKKNAHEFFQLSYGRATDSKEKEEIKKFIIQKTEDANKKPKNYKNDKPHRGKLINFLSKYADDDSISNENEDSCIQEQVEFLISQYIKPYEDDAFRSLAVFHGLDSGELPIENARIWIKFGLTYGTGDSPDLIIALNEYVNMINDDEKNSKLEEIISLCGIISYF
jgi:tetratricopeptide (TPR) repeat protein